MKINCQICCKELKSRVTNWAFYCDNCQYWGANLQPNIDDIQDPIFSELRDDNNVISFLDPIRIENFNKILNYLDLHFGARVSILDVGCASGLFMDMAVKRGHTVTGVDPNVLMYEAAAKKGHTVLHGYFPNCIKNDQKFDVIIFNDVFEHIPDVSSTLVACKNHLNNNGTLLINLPNSNGLIFNVSKLLAKLNFLDPWCRLWQTMFYTPHLHYFNPRSLQLLLSKNNFQTVLAASELRSISLSGLWERISINKKNLSLKNVITYILVIIFFPIIKISPKDAFFSAFK